MTAHIIGKNPTILTYPKGIWGELDSYGINQAAMWFNTRTAFTGHAPRFEEYKDAGIKNCVIAFPFFEGKEAARVALNGHNMNIKMIRQRVIPDTCGIRVYSDAEILAWLQKATVRNGEFPNWETALHLLIFFLIGQRYTTIHLHGCNNTPDHLDGAVDMHKPEYSRIHTEKLVRLAPQVGVVIHWWENFEDYDRGTP